MNNIINPYHPPNPTTENYSHMNGETWMVDGEVVVMTMFMISSKSLSRQGAGIRTADPWTRIFDGVGA